MKLIYAELARIQRELKAPKNLYNSFGKYAYRNAEGILEAVKPLLNGLVLLLSDEIEHIGDRYYVKATVTLTDGEESVSVSASAREDETKKGMDGCQITGACSSYARKYALNGLFDIDDTKDSDDPSLSPKNPANEEKSWKEKGLPEGTPVENDFTRPTVEAKTSVTKVEEIPRKSPVEEYLLAQMKALRIARKITAEENKELFKKQHEALVKASLAPDKKLTEYTMQEAEALIDAMSKCFPLNSAELKTE